MKLAVVGAGKMGLAILKGALDAGVLEPSEVGVLDRDREATEERARALGVRPLLPEDLAEAERILIAVKPQHFPELASNLVGLEAGILSVMAGVRAQRIAEALKTQRVVRAMPNLGVSVGLGTTALTALPEAEAAGDLAFAEALFSALGSAVRLSEPLFDAFTAMSSSALAYLAVAAEALADGGVRMGLSRELAERFAREALAATARLLETRAPAELKNEVTSPGGTTAAGLYALEQGAFRAALIAAVEAATQRGKELGES